MNKRVEGIESFTVHEARSTARREAVRAKTPRKSAAVVREQPISVRFEPEMIERLDRVARQLSKVNVNIRIGRSSVVKLAMERALLALEAELASVRPDPSSQFADPAGEPCAQPTAGRETHQPFAGK